MPPLSEIFPYIVSAGGAYAYFAANRLRQAGLRKAELESDSGWINFYKDRALELLGVVEGMKTEMGQMRQEIFMLRETVESYKNTCEGCPNNKRNKP